MLMGDKQMKTVLVVDDSSFMRTLIKRNIGDLDISVVGEAENGKVAVEKYIELKPDIVTLDLAMNEYDGIGALKEIKKLNPDANVIIVCSTGGQGPIIDEAKALGACAIINKPIKDDELVNAIKSLLD